MTIVWAGLSVGAVYALIAAGYNITMVLGGVFNFAHGGFVVFSAFFAWFIVASQGWPWWAAAVLGALACGFLGTVEERVAIRPVIDRKNAHALLVTTVGAWVVIEGFLLATWGRTPKSMEFFGGGQAVTLLGGRVTPVDLWLIGMAVGLCLAMHVIVRRTLWGLTARAATSDPQAAKARGINVPALRTSAFALAGGVAGLLGPFIGPKIGVTVSVGITLIIYGFVALALGGFGSFLGCLLGGCVIGLIQAFSARYLGVEYPPLILFGLLLLILLLKPTGILGQRGLRAV